MNEIIDSFIKEGSNLGSWELVAVISALIYVALAAKANKWCFPFGFISSSIYIYLSASLAFYYDTLINVYYVAMSVYGWIAWSSVQTEAKTSDENISSLERKRFVYLLLMGLIASTLLALLSSHFLSGSLPYLDAFTTVFSFIATWMVIKKQIENWIIWIVVDFIAAFMYLYKELYLTFFLFIIYTIIAIFGYFKWKKKLVTS